MFQANRQAQPTLPDPGSDDRCGWLGWGAWAVGLFLGFLLGGVFGVALIAVKKGGRKTAVPFGPFMLLGVLIAVLVGADLAQAYLDATGL